MSFLLLACDTGLESNIETSEQEEYVDKVNKATLEEINSLNLIGVYRIDLISKKIDPVRKKKFEFSHKIDIVKYPTTTTVNGRQFPIYIVKAIITHIPDPSKEVSPIQFPTLIANVYFSTLTKEIAIHLGPESGMPIGGGPAQGSLFLATGKIEHTGFKFARIYTHIGEFEPAFAYRLED